MRRGGRSAPLRGDRAAGARCGTTSRSRGCRAVRSAKTRKYEIRETKARNSREGDGLMPAFTYETLPGRVIFGLDSVARLPDEVVRLGVRRALVLCTPGQRPLAESVAGRLGNRAAGIYDGAVMHVPVET